MVLRCLVFLSLLSFAGSPLLADDVGVWLKSL